MYYIDDDAEYNDGKCYIKNQNILVETNYMEKDFCFFRDMLYSSPNMDAFIIKDIYKKDYIVDREDLEIFLVLQLTDINYGDFWTRYMDLSNSGDGCKEVECRILYDKVMGYMELIKDCEKASDDTIVKIDYIDLLDFKLFYMSESDIIIEVNSNVEELEMIGNLLSEDKTKNSFLVQDIFKKKFTVTRQDIYNFYQSYSDYESGSYLVYLKRKFALQLKP